MILDHRTYVCRPGAIRKQLALYEAHGWAPQRRHLGDPVLYAVTESGDVNAYVHVWAYADAADRAAKRAAMQADPEWTAYLERSAEAGWLVSQTTAILTPASFHSPVTRG